MMYGNDAQHRHFYEKSEWFNIFTGAFPHVSPKTKQGGFLVLTMLVNWLLVASMVFHADLADQQQAYRDVYTDLSAISLAWALNLLLVFGCVSMYLVAVCCSSVPRLDIAWHVFGWLLLAGIVFKAILLMIWSPMYFHVYVLQRQVDPTSLYFLWQELQLFLHYVLYCVMLIAGYFWCRFRAATVGKRRF